MSDWLPNDDQICDAMQWRRTALSPALGQARCYLARVACLLDAWTELPGSRLPELERHTAIWAPTGPGALHRRLARALVHRATRSLGDLDLPAPIGAYYTAEFNRIRDDLAQRADGGFSFTRYRFKADLRLLAFRRIPLGMYDLDGATIPRQMLLRQKPWDAWRLTQMVLECAGISPSSVSTWSRIAYTCSIPRGAPATSSSSRSSSDVGPRSGGSRPPRGTTIP